MKSMEKKKENSMANMRFSDENPSATGFGGSIFDMATGACEGSGGDKWGSLGFMDLLAIHQDFVAPSLFDSFQPPPILSPPPPSSSEVVLHRDILHEQLHLDTKELQQQQLQGLPSPASTKPESSDILNNPTTPNSSSVSSSSNEAANDEKTKAGDDEEQDQDQDKTKKQ